MDINDLRGLITLTALVAFLGVCAWAYSARRKDTFDANARLPLEEDRGRVPPTNDPEERI